MNSELINKFSDIWSNIFNKNKSVFVESGTKAITHALRILKSKVVVIPTYTCDRILKAALDADCNPIIVDCEKDLQIDISELSKYEDIDTVIVPHMFGIKADVKLIKSMGYNVIEDCSQAMGFDDIGKYSDVVIASTGGGCKWLSVGNRGEPHGGGIISYDGDVSIDWWNNKDFLLKSIYKSNDIDKNFKLRNVMAQELINADIDLIGKDKPNAWMRAMYFTESQKRVPYTPIHDLYGDFKCPKVDLYKNKLDWISIFV